MMTGIEKAFSTKGSIRVLNVVSEQEKINISSLARKIGMGHDATNVHVNNLKELGLVTEDRDKRNRFIMVGFGLIEIKFERKRGMSVTVQ